MRANMEDFYRAVDEVKDLIENISSHSEKVEQIHGAILSSPNQERKNKDKLELIKSVIKRDVDLVQAKLKLILKKWPVDEKSISPSVMQRIQRNQHSYLTRRFSDVMRDYHQAQVSFRDKCKAQIQRQLEIVDKTISNEELEDMLHCDDLTLFISDVTSKAHISRRALTEIESRHQDIICLESSIKELQEVFVDTAMLLESQGDLINNIEKNVSKAVEDVEVSREETNKAVQYKKHWYKIASIPSFLKPLRRQSSVKTAAGQSSEVKTSK